MAHYAIFNLNSTRSPSVCTYDGTAGHYMILFVFLSVNQCPVLRPCTVYTENGHGKQRADYSDYSRLSLAKCQSTMGCSAMRWWHWRSATHANRIDHAAAYDTLCRNPLFIGLLCSETTPERAYRVVFTWFAYLFNCASRTDWNHFTIAVPSPPQGDIGMTICFAPVYSHSLLLVRRWRCDLPCLVLIGHAVF